MGYFEQKAISAVMKKPARWYRYVDDVFAVWSYGKDDLQNFQQYLNNVQKCIEFTMEFQQDRLYRS
jgi:hypothetical protein